MRVLLVEDDEEFRESLQTLLEIQKYNVFCKQDGVEAWEFLKEQKVDVIVADWNMPNLSGLDLCRMLREKDNNTPILMITARDQIDDRVEALEAGADDYLVKPFANKEMIARIKALVRRAGGEHKELSYGGLVLDQVKHRASLDGRDLKVGPIEWQLLWTLAERAEEVCSQEYLYQTVWGYDFSSLSKTLEVHIGYLRRQLEKDDRPRLIHTVRGFGYVIKEAS